MKKTLCKPCAIELSAKRRVDRVGGRSEKITCDICGRRRYGITYEVSYLRRTGEVKK
jgi:hypothetical protein